MPAKERQLQPRPADCPGRGEADGALIYSNVTVSESRYGSLEAKGEVTLNEEFVTDFGTAAEPSLVCVLKDADGKLVTGFSTYLSGTLTVGQPKAFDFDSFFEGVDYETAEVYANIS